MREALARRQLVLDLGERLVGSAEELMAETALPWQLAVVTVLAEILEPVEEGGAVLSVVK